MSFLAGLLKSGLADTAVAQLANALNTADESAKVATTVWLYDALFAQIFGSTETLDLAGVSGPSLQTMRSLWQASMIEEISRPELEGALIRSDTAWDRFLRDATPDLPTYLSDWAMTGLQIPGRFQLFWAELFWLISQPERREVKKWLEAEAKKLADPSFSLTEPAWMRT